MKRALFESSIVTPYTSGDAIDRSGCLSAVLGVKAAADGSVAVAVTHSDTIDGTYVPVEDERIVVYGSGITLAEDDVGQVGIDLIGCKQYIKLTVTAPLGSALALAIGDADEVPVNNPVE